jgi:hypothetical protein
MSLLYVILKQACVAMGAGKALENYAIIRRSIGGL